MPLLKILPSLISQGSFTGSFSGTSSYARRALTASYALNASGGGGSALTTGSTYPITSSYASRALTASYALNTFFQTGSIVNQTILYNFKPNDQSTITGLNLTDNKWGVSIVEEWDTKLIPGDPYYNSVSLLMHFSGSNGSTVFRDNSQNNFPLTSSNGAAISTAQSKFGGQSGYFDGTNDVIIVPNNSVFDFGSGDFTIEYWEYRTSSDDNRAVLTRENISFAPYFVGHAYAGNLSFYTGNGSSYQVTDLRMGSIILNQWTHYAVTRQGNTYRTFQNGTQIATTTNSSTIMAGSSTMSIGRWNSGYFQGYIDELRITKGVARYTGSFATQSAEFYNNLNVNQTETKYIGSIGGLNDTNVDYGIQKLTNSSLKVRKMSTPGTPVSGSPALSASIDRVYVNVLDYTKVAVTSSYASRALTSSYSSRTLTASYALNASGGGGSTLTTGSTYPITSSYARRAITASYALNTFFQTGSNVNQTILYDFSTNEEATITGLNLTDNKWGVSVIEEWDTKLVPGDQYYNSCSLLMHFNGSNGSTTFIDNSPNAFTVTGFNGVSINTAQSKFGGSSVYFDGTNDYISIAAGQKGNLSSGNYTIEFWLYTTSTTGTFSFIQQGEHDWRLWGGNTSINVTLSSTSTGVSGTFSTNTWNHIALVKNGSTTTLYVNGTSAGTTSLSPANSTNDIYLGVNAASVGNVWYYAGYMDEVRITKGIARYTGSFTPQSAEFYNNLNVNQTQTKYIGSVGGLNDTNVDYGIQKLSNSSLKVRKMSTPGTPVSGSPSLSASIDRVYVNVFDYTKVAVTSSYASRALTASYVNGGITAGRVYALTSLFS